jgi:CBS domain containing-hemolysin-like protein
LTLFLLFLVVLLVFVNGFFVAAEFALVRSRPSRMEKMAEEGSRAAALALRQMQHIDEYIAAAQVVSRSRRSASASWASPRSRS